MHIRVGHRDGILAIQLAFWPGRLFGGIRAIVMAFPVPLEHPITPLFQPLELCNKRNGGLAISTARTPIRWQGRHRDGGIANNNRGMSGRKKYFS